MRRRKGEYDSPTDEGFSSTSTCFNDYTVKVNTSELGEEQMRLNAFL